MLDCRPYTVKPITMGPIMSMVTEIRSRCTHFLQPRTELMILVALDYPYQKLGSTKNAKPTTKKKGARITKL